MINCVTYSPLKGFVPGIELEVDVPTMRNDGSVYPPHVKIGREHIMIDKVKTPTIKDGMLTNAVLRELASTTGRPFTTFARADATKSIFVLVDLNALPAGVRRRKINPDEVQAWVDFETDGNLLLNHNSSGRALIEFSKDGQSAFIFDRDGAVHHIARQHGSLRVVPMGRREMACERVLLMESQIGDLEGGEGEVFRKRDAILAGASRLLKVSSGDEAVRDVLVDFLVEYANGRMGSGIRDQIRFILREAGDMRACMFEEGYGFGVISLDRERDKRTKPHNNKADRRDRDRTVRLQKKTPSGGKPAVVTNPKKAAKRERQNAARK